VPAVRVCTADVQAEPLQARTAQQQPGALLTVCTAAAAAGRQPQALRQQRRVHLGPCVRAATAAAARDVHAAAAKVPRKTPTVCCWPRQPWQVPISPSASSSKPVASTNEPAAAASQQHQQACHKATLGQPCGIHQTCQQDGQAQSCQQPTPQLCRRQAAAAAGWVQQAV
jgi:hypothetical protein